MKLIFTRQFIGLNRTTNDIESIDETAEGDNLDGEVEETEPEAVEA